MKKTTGQKKLAKYLEWQGINVYQWSKKHNISQAVISKYQRGVTKLGPENARKISEATEGFISIEELLY